MEILQAFSASYPPIYPHLDKPLRCGHCGHTGQDVRMFLEYVGGQGEIPMPQCTNRKECWNRWNKQHGN